MRRRVINDVNTASEPPWATIATSPSEGKGWSESQKTATRCSNWPRLSPKLGGVMPTFCSQAAAEAVDRTAGRAYVAVNHGVAQVRSHFVSEDGAPRLERVVPVAVAAVAVVVVVAGLSRRRRRR